MIIIQKAFFVDTNYRSLDNKSQSSHFKDGQNNNANANSGFSTNGPGSPNDPEDNDFFKKIRNNAQKKARTKQFGNMYKDPKTGLWWSVDK